MAKKRYHQSVKDRLAESRGMEHKMMGKSSGSFNGEFHDDPSAPSYMPQTSVYKNWVQNRYENDPYLDDTIRGIDKQMSDDVSGMMKNRSRSKY